MIVRKWVRKKKKKYLKYNLKYKLSHFDPQLINHHIIKHKFYNFMYYVCLH